MSGIDATIELVAELDRLSVPNAIARDAPRSSALYSYLALGVNSASDGRNAYEFMELCIQLIERLGVWWSPSAYRQMPIMTPWCVRDRSCRYDQGPESWGAPRDDGYFRDDNSIIKKLPLPLEIVGPVDSPYRGRKPWRGFTACHIWRELADGGVAGEDPWLYSFMPNLIWLPRWIAPLTDRPGPIQALLKRTSITRFRTESVHPSVRPYAEKAWRRLSPPPAGVELRPHGLANFRTDREFFAQRIRYLDKIVQACDAVIGDVALTKKLISSRYTAGLPGLGRGNITRFQRAMDDYRTACGAASAEMEAAEFPWRKRGLSQHI